MPNFVKTIIKHETYDKVVIDATDEFGKFGLTMIINRRSKPIPEKINIWKNKFNQVQHKFQRKSSQAWGKID